jgi:NADH:ubiquinone oxidoreductase subunit 6 (subunit J)
MSQVIFFIAAIGAISGAIGVVLVRNPFYAVLSLVCHLISLAALFLLLRAQFVAAAQVVVYAGAVMVLYVFVVAYVGDLDEPLHRPGGALKVLAPVFGLCLAVELFFAVLGTALKGIGTAGAHFSLVFGTPAQIGTAFLTTYLFPFEVASLILMVAAVGAIVLARRRRGLDDDGIDEELRTRLRPAYTGTMAESIGVPSRTPQPPSQLEIRSGEPVPATGGTGGQSDIEPDPRERNTQGWDD